MSSLALFTTLDEVCGCIEVGIAASTSATEVSMVVTLCKQGVPLIQVQRAILLGALRKYAAIAQNGPGTPSSSSHASLAFMKRLNRKYRLNTGSMLPQ
jgi:hypothetical protein